MPNDTLTAVERVARALAAAEGEHWFGSDAYKKHNNRWLKLANAAIDTLAKQARPEPVNERLVEALDGLLGWGEHDEGCALNAYMTSHPGCSCGMTAAEDKARAAITEATNRMGMGDE